MLITRGAGVRCLLGLALLLSACSGGGGGDDTPPIPWGRLRTGPGNTGFASGTLSNNKGIITPFIELGPNAQAPGVDGLPVQVGGLTTSTPIIGANGLVYLGTTAGLLVMDPDVEGVRLFNQCDGVTVGPVSGTAAINPNDDVVVGSDEGRVFAFHDDGKVFECLWVFPPGQSTIADGVVSSALLLSDPVDRTLTSAFIGLGNGYFQALNNFGLQQWRFPVSEPLSGPLTSSAATDGTLLHITTPDGVLYSLDRAGRIQHQAQVSVPATNPSGLLQSPVSGSSLYAIGLGGRCSGDDVIFGCLTGSECVPESCGDLGNVGILTALNSLDEVRWRFATDAPIKGDASFVIQSIDEPVLPNATPTPRTPPQTPQINLTPTPTRIAAILQGIVYVVDNDGTVYGVKDVSGDVYQSRPTMTPATPTPTPTFIPGADTPTQGPAPTEVALKPAKAQLLQPVTVAASPVLSADLFVVYGTTGGELYALRLDFDRTEPCEDCDSGESEWVGIPLADGSTGGGKVEVVRGSPIVSTPVIDRDGTIYVTVGDVSTGAGTLYEVGTP